MGLFLKPSQLQKARALPDGTIRTWSGKKYKKVAGKWQPFSEGKEKSTPDVNLSASDKSFMKQVAKMQSDKAHISGGVPFFALEDEKIKIKGKDYNALIDMVYSLEKRGAVRVRSHGQGRQSIHLTKVGKAALTS